MYPTVFKNGETILEYDGWEISSSVRDDGTGEGAVKDAEFHEMGLIAVKDVTIAKGDKLQASVMELPCSRECCRRIEEQKPMPTEPLLCGVARHPSNHDECIPVHMNSSTHQFVECSGNDIWKQFFGILGFFIKEPKDSWLGYRRYIGKHGWLMYINEVMSGYCTYRQHGNGRIKSFVGAWTEVLWSFVEGWM